MIPIRLRPALFLIVLGASWPALRAQSASITDTSEPASAEARIQEESEKAKRARGRALINQAFARLKENDRVGAITLFRAGLELCPDDRDARFELARIWLSARRYSTGRDLFLQQLEFGYPGREYLAKVWDFLNQTEDWAAISTLCERALALHDASSHPETDRGWLQARWARALEAAKDWSALERLLTEHGDALAETERRELRLMGLLDRGRIEEARAWMDEWRAEAGPTPQVLRLQARTCRDAGDLAGMAEALAEVVGRHPTEPRLRVFAVIQHLLAGSEDEAGRQLDAYLLRFGATKEHLILMADSLVKIGRERELERVLAAAKEQGLADPLFHVLRLHLLMEKRRWDEAAAVLDTLRAFMESGPVSVARGLAVTENLLRAVRDPGEQAQAGFLARLDRLAREPAIYRQCAEVLLAGGRDQTARRVVASGLALYPDNVSFLALSERLGAAPSAIPAPTTESGAPASGSR